MAYPVNEVLDYIAYMHGRGASFPYHDFEASDLTKPQAVRDAAVIFPAGWTQERRNKWRARNKLGIPAGQAQTPLVAIQRDYSRTGETE